MITNPLGEIRLLHITSLNDFLTLGECPCSADCIHVLWLFTNRTLVATSINFQNDCTDIRGNKITLCLISL